MTKEQWLKILKGAGIAAAGALLTYGANVLVPFLDTNGGLWGPAISGVLAIVINALRKLLEQQSEAK